jgi:hypothetical protein
VNFDRVGHILEQWSRDNTLGFEAEGANLYAYAWESPTNFTDPLGLDAIAIPTSPGDGSAALTA